MSVRKMSTSTVKDRRDYSNMSTSVSSGWAEIASSSVSPAEYSDGDIVWQYYKFTATGTITFASPGYVDLLVVGGGGGGGISSPFPSSGGGGAGAVRWGVHPVEAIEYTATVGAGGVFSVGYAVAGNSSFGSVLKSGGGRSPRITDYDPHDRLAPLGGGGASGGMTSFEATVTNMPGGGAGGSVYGANLYDGISLNYDGSSVEYGVGGRLSVTPVANTGSGGREGNYNGTDGVVIVRVRIQ